MVAGMPTPAGAKVFLVLFLQKKNFLLPLPLPKPLLGMPQMPEALMGRYQAFDAFAAVRIGWDRPAG